MSVPSTDNEVYAKAPKSKAVSLKDIQALSLVRKYPIPVFALVSLIFGAILHWVFNMSDEAHWLWFITLIIGGAPVVWETARGITRRQFASDIVATMAIIAAIALNDAFPGVVIVLMQTGGKALEDYAFRRASSSLMRCWQGRQGLHIDAEEDLIEEVDVKALE